MTLAAVPESPVSSLVLASVIARAEEARTRAEVVSAVAQRLVLESRELRTGAEQRVGPLRFFVLEGEVDDLPVKGRWLAGTLTASSRLRTRAQLVIQLEERFELEPGGPVVAAGLDQPMPALLTLVRACDRIRSVLIGPLGSLPLLPGKAP